MDHLVNLKHRVVQSLTQVIKVYFVYALIGALAYGAWTFFATAAISFSQLCMTAATIWGLLQISVLMGYGLVLLPQGFREQDI